MTPDTFSDSSSEQDNKVSSKADANSSKGQVSSTLSDSILALQALQLLVKDIKNIKDPSKAEEKRKKCYDAFDKLVENVDSGNAFKIREESKRFIQEIKWKSSMYIVTVISFVICLLYLIHGLVVNQASSGVMLPSLCLLFTVAFISLVGLPIIKDTKGKK